MNRVWVMCLIGAAILLGMWIAPAAWVVFNYFMRGLP